MGAQAGIGQCRHFFNSVELVYSRDFLYTQANEHMMQTNLAYQSNKLKRAIMTRHAEKRSAQRGFTRDSVELIRAFGERSHDGHGGIRCLMTRAAVERLANVLGRSQRLDALAGAYVVLSADDEAVVITASHRYQ